MINRYLVVCFLAFHFCSLVSGRLRAEDANNSIKMELSMSPLSIALPKNNLSTASLLSWKITNLSSSPIRFRARNLGALEIRDKTGALLTNYGGSRDMLLKFTQENYPIIMPGRSIFLAMNVNLFYDNKILCIQIDNSFDGSDGALFKNLSPGDYILSVKYEASDPDVFEQKQLVNLRIRKYWLGSITSADIPFHIE